MPPPAWLGPDAPESDVVISSRCRYARNLHGYRFPHHAVGPELGHVEKKILEAVRQTHPKALVFSRLTEAEHDYLLGSRMISPDFPHRELYRAVILDEERVVSLMVNEEDHIRLQALTAGWSIKQAQASAEKILGELSERLEFMQTRDRGFLTASPSNLGEGRRRSALFHLIGLAHAKRLSAILAALVDRGLATRGLYGETSRGIGAFFQVSGTHVRLPELLGAAEFLMAEEREARRSLGRRELAQRAYAAAEFAIASSSMGLGDALSTLAWIRWGASSGVPGMPSSFRDVDSWIATMELHGTSEPALANRRRAEFLRVRLESCATH